MEDSSVDYQLVSQCRAPIQRLCQNVMLSEALECLKFYLNEPTLEANCKTIVLRRVAEQNLDIRFNPVLRKACSLDIPKFCSQVPNVLFFILLFVNYFNILYPGVVKCS